MITDEERNFIRHALGLTYKKVGYRNFYRAGGDDAEIGRALVRKGMAIELTPSPGYPDPCFLISTSGFRAAAKRGEKMDEEETQKMTRRIDPRAFRAEPVQ